MLLSMTGFGSAQAQNERMNVSVEVRAVNSRYFKITFRGPESLAARESDVEKIVRKEIGRGTVQVSVRLESVDSDFGYQLDTNVLERYWAQLHGAANQLGVKLSPEQLPQLLMLPGVAVEAQTAGDEATSNWPLIESALNSALEKLKSFRAAEGESMRQDLITQCGIIRRDLEEVIQIAPRVVSEFRDRLHQRVGELLAEFNVSLDAPDLIREVSLFSERSDINEEITRLKSHLDQFDTTLAANASQGRKLEFLTQEMFREVNTIGSKANNVAIAHSVVDMKAAIEKLREILQNVE